MGLLCTGYGNNIEDTMKKVPMTVAGVGVGPTTRWIYSNYGHLLNVYGIYNKISITFNTDSVDDIENKIRYLEELKDRGYCNIEEVCELKERLKTISNLSVGGKGQQVFGVQESCKGSKEGKIETVYRDGKAVKVKRRGRFKISTDEQKRAAENARKYAHTDEANKKRRKSINARGEGKILGDI